MSGEGVRPDPGFSVVIVAGEPGDDGRELACAVQDAYDICINSLDFGSGFLSTEEFNNMRLLGKAIGASPLHQQDCEIKRFRDPHCTCDLAQS